MRTHTLAIVSLIFGLLSWIGLPLVGAIVAVITGHLARAEITRSPEQFDGNGMALAQEARQKFGPEMITELIATDAWHREFTPGFRSAFEDRTIFIPADRDVRDDLRQITMIGGVGKVPRTKGTDGGKRHADTAVALMNFHAATQAKSFDYGYRAASDLRAGDRDHDDRAGTARFARKGAW